MKRDIDDTKDEAVNVDIYLLDKNAFTPKSATSGVGGFDLHSLYDYTIKSNSTLLIKTGLIFGIPNGYELQIKSHIDYLEHHLIISNQPDLTISNQPDLIISNQPATIGSKYRGEVMILLDNFGSNEIEIKAGDRVAQAVLRKKVEKVNFIIMPNNSRFLKAFAYNQ